MITHKNVTSEYFHTHIHSSASSAWDRDIYICLLPIKFHFLRAGKGTLVEQVDDLQQKFA